MVLVRAWAVVVALSVVSLTAVADLVCEEGNCISDPSLTADDSSYGGPATTAHASGASPITRSSTAQGASIGFTDLTNATSVGGAIGAVATTLTSANSSGVTATECSSQYSSLPLTSSQQAICDAGKARLIAAAEQKAKEKADTTNQAARDQQGGQQKQQPQQPQQQPQQQQSPQAKSDQKSGENESDPCQKKLAQIVKQCSDLGNQADENCNPETDPDLTSSMSQMQKSTNGMNSSSYNSNNQASGGCAIGSQGMSHFAGTCSGGQFKMGQETVGHEACSSQCAKLAQKVMATPECKQAKNDGDKKRASKKIVSRKEACDALKKVSEGAKENAESLAQCSGRAGQNAGFGAGGLGDMMKALASMGQKAQQEKQRQDVLPDAVGAIDVCTDSSVMAGVPQICICQKQGLDEKTCASRLSYSIAPTGPGLTRDPASVTTINPTTTALPAGVTGP